MDFIEAEHELLRLQEQKRQGSISAQDYAEAVNNLQVMDSQGRWWQPHPDGEGWLRWDGAQWVPDSPPAEPGPGVQEEPTAKRRPAEFMDPQRFLEISRQTPWNRRPQSWWDSLAIAGGAASGYLWFVYSSVRGMPRLTFLPLGRESWFDLLPALVLLAIPLLLFVSGRSPVTLVQAGVERLRGLSSGARWGYGLVAVLLIAGLQTNNPLFSQREGLDLISPVLMVAIPALLVWFRPETDRLLAPFQGWRRKIPQSIRVGMSLAIPFLTAYFFYNFLGISQYQLLRLNVVAGTLLSYAMLRNPNSSTPVPQPVLGQILTLLGLSLAAACCPELAWADDFLRDPFNLRDGLRTDGIAPVLAGISTVVVSILVNGVEVAKVMIQDTKPAEEGKEQHKKFVVLVSTVDTAGATSTTLDQLGNATIFIYAHCEEVGKGRFPAGDSTIQIALTSAVNWVALKDLGTQHGKRCASLTFADPVPAGEPPETAGIRVTAGVGELISTEIDIALKPGGLVLEVF